MQSMVSLYMSVSSEFLEHFLQGFECDRFNEAGFKSVQNSTDARYAERTSHQLQRQTLSVCLLMKTYPSKLVSRRGLLLLVQMMSYGVLTLSVESPLWLRCLSMMSTSQLGLSSKLYIPSNSGILRSRSTILDTPGQKSIAMKVQTAHSNGPSDL